MVRGAGIDEVNMGFYLTRWFSPLQGMIQQMMANHFDDEPQLRARIAAAAARMIAQDGADYSSAKRKAARQILGSARNCALPDNAQIEQEVHLYNALFLSDTQPARLLHLRTLALQAMRALAQFHPMLTGAVLNGTAGAHSDIDLQLFADSAKDVELFLLDKNIAIDLSETPHFKGAHHALVETVSFAWQQETVHAALYRIDDLRGALKTRPGAAAQRADCDGVQALLDKNNTINSNTTPTERDPAA
jgi:hypothetical protein